jgi:hypothetical protein
MNEHVEKLKAISELLMEEVNAIDRIIPYTIEQYPSWDNADMDEFKSILISNIAEILGKINLL